jgi:hypothetical protein
MIFHVCCLLLKYCVNEELQLYEEVCIERMFGANNTHELGYLLIDIVSLPHSGSRYQTR